LKEGAKKLVSLGKLLSQPCFFPLVERRRAANISSQSCTVTLYMLLSADPIGATEESSICFWGMDWAKSSDAKRKSEYRMCIQIYNHCHSPVHVELTTAAREMNTSPMRVPLPLEKKIRQKPGVSPANSLAYKNIQVKTRRIAREFSCLKIVGMQEAANDTV